MLLDRIWNGIWIKYKGVTCGKNMKIRGRAWFHGVKNSIFFGNDVTIISTPNVNPTAGGFQSHFRTVGNGKIKVGNNVGMTRVEITSYESVTIDDDVLLGGNCIIWDSDFHSLIYSERMEKPDVGVRTKPVRIRKGAWIGAASIILKGVEIGEYSVIGAGSVVTQNVPTKEIWGGNPARFIRKLE
ncbi:acyltransferase [Butyrivibrio sp. AC2005]|uniref:acyltransferase n=1 Tax=Butyrivibrio sp. AC2005 TaxID=1280672 RepID=UPI00040C76F9|nr:acyltransferase [Butyrivibrio sp. AC2005]